MLTVNQKLEFRIPDNFFGANAKDCIHNFNRYQQQKFISEAKNVYKQTLNYICQNYKFESNPIQYLLALML